MVSGDGCFGPRSQSAPVEIGAREDGECFAQTQLPEKADEEDRAAFSASVAGAKPGGCELTKVEKWPLRLALCPTSRLFHASVFDAGGCESKKMGRLTDVHAEERDTRTFCNSVT